VGAKRTSRGARRRLQFPAMTLQIILVIALIALIALWFFMRKKGT
jgi:hypothetical protein